VMKMDSVSHTGKDSDSDVPNFRLTASEFLMTHDVWTGDKDYERLGLELERLLAAVFKQGRSNMLRELVNMAIKERTRK
jgi:hypothetical protein